MLKSIIGHPEKFVDTATGKIFDVRNYRAFVYTSRFIGFSTQQIKPIDEDWLLKSWSILIHPWPKVIPPSILVELVIDGRTEADAPLFSVAEPLTRSDDQGLRDRIEAIEKKLKMEEPIRPVKKLNRMLTCKHQHLIHARIKKGEPVDLDPFLYLDTFELQLSGIKRWLDSK